MMEDNKKRTEAGKKAKDDRILLIMDDCMSSKGKWLKDDQILELRTFILDNLDKYLKFNLNHNSLINAINSKINHA